MDTDTEYAPSVTLLSILSAECPDWNYDRSSLKCLRSETGSRSGDKRASCIPRHGWIPAFLPRQQLRVVHLATSLMSKRSRICVSYTVLGVDMVSRLQRRSIETGKSKHVTCWNYKKARLNLCSVVDWRVSSGIVPAVTELINLRLKARNWVKRWFMWEAIEGQMAMHVSLPFWTC